MPTKLAPLGGYAEPDYPKANGTLIGKLLVAASMAATSLGGCGPAVDPHTVDSAVDTGDLDATADDAAKATPKAADTNATPGTNGAPAPAASGAAK
jgi:hypothetical protein